MTKKPIFVSKRKLLKNIVELKNEVEKLKTDYSDEVAKRHNYIVEAERKIKALETEISNLKKN